MKNFFLTGLALVAALSSAMPMSAAPESEASATLATLEARQATCTRPAVDRLVFKTSMKTFQAARKKKSPRPCNWTSDGCSWSPDRPLLVYNFRPACQRHDFGYRNMKKQKRFTKAMKARVDLQFRKDLYAYCGGFKGAKRSTCRRLANTYYNVVKRLGKRDLGAINDVALAERDVDLSQQEYTKREEALNLVESGEETNWEVDPDIEGEELPEITDEEFDDEDFEDVEDDEEGGDEE